MKNELFENIKNNLEKYRFNVENFNPLALPIRLTLIPFSFQILPFAYTIKVIDLEHNTEIGKFQVSFDGKNVSFKVVEVRIG